MPTDRALGRIHAQLENVIHGRREVVDGVDIVLRHEMLPSDDWRPSYLIDFGTSPEPPSQAPFIWFPWFGPYDEGAVRRQAQARMAEQAKGINSRRPRDRQSKYSRARRKLPRIRGVY